MRICESCGHRHWRGIPKHCKRCKRPLRSTIPIDPVPGASRFAAINEDGRIVINYRTGPKPTH